MRRFAFALEMTALLALTACAPDAMHAADGAVHAGDDAAVHAGDDAAVHTGDDAATAGGGTLFGSAEDGIATYYDATGAGNCSFDPSPDDLMVAAMDIPEYANSAVCGECVAVTGPMGNTITVRIVDSCPGCEAGHLDLSSQAFAMLEPLSRGRITIHWQPVTCAVAGSVQYAWKDGSSQYWAGLQVRNHRVPVQSIEVQHGGAWTMLARQSYNYFTASGLGPGPFSIRVTAQDGQQIVDDGIALDLDHVVSGAHQFD